MTAKKKKKQTWAQKVYFPALYLRVPFHCQLLSLVTLGTTHRADGLVFLWIMALISGTTLVPILRLKPFSSTYLKPLSTAGPYTR